MHAGSNLPDFKISDDVLFPWPSRFSDWDSCVALWNETVEYLNERKLFLKEMIIRTAQHAALSEVDRAWLENNIQGLAGRIQLLDSIQTKAIAAGYKLKFGFTLGDVVEIKSGTGSRLVEIMGGGLPRYGVSDDSTIRVNPVEPYCGGWISASPAIMSYFNLSNIASFEVTLRRDIRPTHPQDAPQHQLPNDIFDDDLFDSLQARINPKHGDTGRQSVLLAFWLAARQARKPASFPFEPGDIVLLCKGPTKQRCVVFHRVAMKSSEFFLGYDPMSRRRELNDIGALDEISARPEQVTPAFSFRDYFPSGGYCPAELSMAVGLWKTTQL